MKILFHTHSRRAFTTTLIGVVHELSQQHEIFLLTEELSPSSLAMLNNRTLFPGLQEIITLDPLEFRPGALLKKNRRLARNIREMIDRYRPDIVASENDMMSLFDLYLMRCAKRRGLPTITFQAMAEFKEADNQTYVRLLHLFPDGKPASKARLLARWVRMQVRRQLGHLLVHFILPYGAGLGALWGRSSYMKWRGASGMRESDLNLVLTPETHEEYQRRGVPAAKLGLLRHPLERGSPRELFFGPPVAAKPSPERVLLVLMGCVVPGFEKTTLRPIPSDRRRQCYQAIIALAQRALPDWTILVKPHPLWQTREKARAFLGEIGSATLADPAQAVEPLFATATAIMDLPPAASTTLFVASRGFPEKTVIAADVLQEFYGDNYRQMAGVNYVPGMAELEELLERVRALPVSTPLASPRKPALAHEFISAHDAVTALLQGA